MFKKLDTQIKKNEIKGISLITLREKKELEKELIFGNLLEELASIKIELAYESLNEEIPTEGSANGLPSTEDVVSAQDQLKKAQVEKKINDLKAKTEKQVDSLQNQINK